MSDSARRWLVTGLLVAVAAVWGSTFVVVQDAVAAYPVYSFLGLRFAIACVAFIAIFPSTLRRFDMKTLWAGLIAGVFLTLGYVLQTLGLTKTSPSKAAFITGMFVVLTPFMQAVLLKRMPRWSAWVGVGTAVVGLWLLSGGASGGWNFGDTLVLGCAVAYSAHMIVLGSIGRGFDMRPLTMVQLATCAIVCGAIGVTTERVGLPTRTDVWIALLITGVAGSAIAFAVQTYAQKWLSPTRTALILIMEPAFGGLFGWLLAGEVLKLRGWAGAGLILAGMAASELLAVVVSRKGEQRSMEPSLEGPPVPVIEPSDGRMAAGAGEAGTGVSED